MPRGARLLLPDLPVHVRQRGVDREACFLDEDDYRLCEGLIGELSRETQCAVHAYVLMPNHMHLLLSAAEPRAMPAFMKHVGQRYAQHFNRKNKRVGHLFENRYRSSIVDTERYLLTCYKYIELNPVRGGLARWAGAYRWSSFASNGLGIPSLFIAPHPEFARLGRSEAERRQAYLRIVQEGLCESTLAAIRGALDSGRPLGSKEFVADLERQMGKEMRATRRGRPAR